MPSRRQFFDVLVRGGIFSGLTLLGIDLIGRWNEADGCRQDFVCGKCKLSGRCQLPEADDYRLEKAKRQTINPEDGRKGK